jgi:hypothetical protein
VFGVGEEFFVLGSCEEVLHGWVAESGEGIADHKEDEAPGKEVGAYEEEAGYEEEDNV